MSTTTFDTDTVHRAGGTNLDLDLSLGACVALTLVPRESLAHGAVPGAVAIALRLVEVLVLHSLEFRGQHLAGAGLGVRLYAA